MIPEPYDSPTDWPPCIVPLSAAVTDFLDDRITAWIATDLSPSAHFIAVDRPGPGFAARLCHACGIAPERQGGAKRLKGLSLMGEALHMGLTVSAAKRQHRIGRGKVDADGLHDLTIAAHCRDTPPCSWIAGLCLHGVLMPPLALDPPFRCMLKP